MRGLGRALLILAAAAFGGAAYAFLTLPDVRVLRTRNPATTAFMALRAREAAAKGQPVRRLQRWVPYNRISASLSGACRRGRTFCSTTASTTSRFATREVNLDGWSSSGGREP